MRTSTKLILFITLVFFTGNLSGQSRTKLPPKISDTNIVGLWQLGSPVVAAYIGENFRFFKNGEFIYHYDPSSDTRNIIALKGTYRLVDSSLYLTIKFRVVRSGGKIQAGSLGQDIYLFGLYDTVTKDEAEKGSVELAPIDIYQVKISRSNILNVKINNRRYFRISSDPKKYQ